VYRLPCRLPNTLNGGCQTAAPFLQNCHAFRLLGDVAVQLRRAALVGGISTVPPPPTP
jgi:hypothetical protein